VSVTVAEALEAGGIFGVIALVWLGSAKGTYSRWRLERRAARRAHVSELVAVQASLEDEAFVPERIREVVDEILDRVSLIWSGVDISAIEDLPDARMVSRWAGDHHRRTTTRLVDGRRVDLLRVLRRGDLRESRVILRVRLRIHQDQVAVRGMPRMEG
jgi:hypothetical protein